MSGKKPKKMLLTGYPGCGKTTAIMKIILQLNPEKMAGFYTQEIRCKGRRVGFQWYRLDGKEGVLAHVENRGPFSVGKYTVDVSGFENAVVPILDIRQNPAELFVIDEIGKMECFSGVFVEAVRKLFASDRSVLASVALTGSGLISEVKKYPDARIFYLTVENRNQIIDEILPILAPLKKQPGS